MTVNGTPYHKSCFKCTHGGCVISPSNYIAHDGKLYCKHHHIQLIKEKGNLSQLEGDHEKSAIQEKTNGEVVAAETWKSLKMNIPFLKFHISVYHVFLLYLSHALSLVLSPEYSWKIWYSLSCGWGVWKSIILFLLWVVDTKMRH